MTIRAILHRVVVQPVELEVYDDVAARLKAMGLERGITEETKFHGTQIDQGYIIDIGPTAFLDYVKKHNQDIPVRIGTLVTYARHSGKHITDTKTQKDVVVLNDDDILAYHQED